MLRPAPALAARDCRAPKEAMGFAEELLLEVGEEPAWETFTFNDIIIGEMNNLPCIIKSTIRMENIKIKSNFTSLITRKIWQSQDLCFKGFISLVFISLTSNLNDFITTVCYIFTYESHLVSSGSCYGRFNIIMCVNNTCFQAARHFTIISIGSKLHPWRK